MIARDTAARPPAAAGDRGRLVIDQAVVRKVAQRAADEVPGTAARARRVGRPGANARVSGNGDEVDLVIELALHYPAPVREVVDRVRTRVTDEVRRITAYRVRSLDVTVSALLPDIPPRVE